jgi:hypothetical protein
VSEFLVAVKPSARRSNAAAGRVVCHRGSRHRFDDRSEAESWADELAAGDGTVWIRAANPDDRSDVDAYLVGWLRRGDTTDASPRPTGSTDVSRRSTPSGSTAEQAWLANYREETDGRPEVRGGSRLGGERITDWLVLER